MRKPNLAVSVLMPLVLCTSLASCQLLGPKKVVRGTDDSTVDDVALSRKLDLKDVDIALQKLLKQLDESTWAAKIRASGEEPGLAVMPIRNETDIYGLDTTNLRETFEELVLDMGCFSIVAAGEVDKFKGYMTEQQSDWYNGATIPEAGNLFGFTYVIGGLLKGETERNRSAARTQYRLYLQAIDISTGVKKWKKAASVTKFQG